MRRSAQDTDWRPVTIVGATLMVSQLGFYVTTAALSLYLHDLGAAQSRIGLEVGLGNATALVVTLLVGPAINRVGARAFMAGGAALYLFTALGMLGFQREAAVGFLRALQGVGTAGLLPSAFVLVARLVPRRPATALGVIGAFNTIALAVGPPLGLTLYTRYGSSGIFVPAALLAALALFSTTLIPHVAPPPAPARGFGFDRAWIPAVLCNTLAAMYFGGILAYLPLSLQRVHGPNAGIFFTADAVGVLLLRLPTGMLADRKGSRLPKLLGLGITLPGIAILSLPSSIVVLALSGALTGIGAGLLVTGITADLSALSSEGNRGTAMAVAGASFSGGIFAGSAISGLLIGSGGFHAVLLFGGITCLAAVPFGFGRGYRPARELAAPGDSTCQY